MKGFQTLRSQLSDAFSLYLEIISDKRGDRTSIIATATLNANHYSTRAEIFDKFVMYFKVRITRTLI